VENPSNVREKNYRRQPTNTSLFRAYGGLQEMNGVNPNQRYMYRTFPYTALPLALLGPPLRHAQYEFGTYSTNSTLRQILLQHLHFTMNIVKKNTTGTK
jgi:hypothetical protein